MKLKPLVLMLSLLPVVAMASSHREAPFIAGQPTVDATDFYMFMSYEPDRAGYVTLLANYDPLQDPGGGPNYFALNPSAVYDIHIDNDGDARPDLTFRFRFSTEYRNIAVPGGDGQTTAIPLINAGGITAADQSALNRVETYTVELLNGDPRKAPGKNLTTRDEGTTIFGTGKQVFTKPVDNIGNKSIPDYAAYASTYVYNTEIPGCPQPGRVFVGQRKDPFVVNLGEVFDLVNLNPVSDRDATHNTLTHKNVTTLALEVPAACLTHGSDSVIGGWTTASLPKNRTFHNLANALDPHKDIKDDHGPYVQVSRLGAPLVNELVIGLKDKDRFNNSEPRWDGQFARYVTNPSLPVLLNVLFGDAAKVPHTPRLDLVTAFLTGVPGLNQPSHVTPSEMLRLNTAIEATAPAEQNDLGVLGGDLAGFPNGRRPYDDVVDIELRVAEGALCGQIGDCGDQSSDANGGKPYTDGARAAGATMATADATGNESAGDTYMDHFPYAATPLPGSPNGSNSVPAN